MTSARQSHTPATWAVVLAAGEGSRLSALTRDSSGIAVPKQFCSLNGAETLLAETLMRAHRIADEERVAVIVAAQHRRWWESIEQSIPNGHTIVQPMNRGTANGILLAALTIARHDPLARVVFLPSDHYVEDEVVLGRALAVAAARALPKGELLLLGVEPSSADPELGYIVPRSPCRPLGRSRIRRFVEKPSASVAAKLIGEGALWNSFVLVAEVATIANLVRSHYPAVVANFESALAHGPNAIDELYAGLPLLDFSRHILQHAQARVSVLRVPECGWSDLGTPHSVAACLGRLPDSVLLASASRNASSVSLAVALAAGGM